MKTNRSPAAEGLTELILEVFRFRGSLERHGAALTAPHGQTPARWQVMGAAWGDRRTVAQIARRMGLARQSVQRIADLLVAEGLAQFVGNPDHARSQILELTPRGIAVVAAINQAQIRWSNDLARDLSPRQLKAATAMLRQLSDLLEDSPPPK